MLFTTSLPTALDHGAGIGGVAVSMVFIGLGVGAVKATFFPFLGAEWGFCPDMVALSLFFFTKPISTSRRNHSLCSEKMVISSS